MASRVKLIIGVLLVILIRISIFGYSYQEFNKIENELTHLFSLTQYDEIIIRTENLLEEKLSDNQKVSVYFFRGNAFLKKGELVVRSLQL